jgi:hypothetical protein
MGMWWVDGRRKSRSLGLITEMSKTAAREAVKAIVVEENAKRQRHRVWKFDEIVRDVYFPY